MVFTLRAGVYLHTAYAQASDGSVGFRTDSAADAAYLGQYTDGRATDATDPSRYTWTLIDVGDDAELVEEDDVEVEDGTDVLIDLLSRDLYDTGQFAPDSQATSDRKVQTYFQPDEPDPEEFVRICCVGIFYCFRHILVTDVWPSQPVDQLTAERNPIQYHKREQKAFPCHSGHGNAF